MSDAERWNRVAATLAAADLPVTTVSSRSFHGGVGYFISSKLPSGELIEVADRWWRKNLNVWIGYEVTISGRDDITRRQWPITKKRSEVVAAVREALMLAEVGVL